MVEALTKLLEVIKVLFDQISKNKDLAYLFKLIIFLLIFWVVTAFGYKVFSVIMKRKDRFMCRHCFEDSQKRFSELAQTLDRNTRAIEQFNRQRGL
jgi:hypothetical protein